MTPEDLLNFVVTSCQQQAAHAWLDTWDPRDLLEASGFGALCNAQHVHAIGANEDARVEDIVVCFQGEDGINHLPLADGRAKLAVLRNELHEELQKCGNVHWATVTDVVALGEILNLGFIIFSDVPQEGSHVYSLSQSRADYDWWVLLYCRGNTHYQLASWKSVNSNSSQSFFHVSEIPRPLQAAFNIANANCPIGQAHGGGIA